MEMVEVDVELFITCRLCLDEPGVYQIIPSIKELIKDCFDIDTDPFDGLPQLICKKCKSTLGDYHAIKTVFKQKQHKLRERLVKQDDHSTQPTPTHPPESVSCKKIIENGEISTVTSVLPQNPFPIVALGKPVDQVQPDAPVEAAELVAHTPSDDVNEVVDTWKSAYNERYFCKICPKSYQRSASIKRHVTTHKKILKKHKKIFRKYCIVQLNKVDTKKNCTGNSNVVVYNSDKIITTKGNSHYHSYLLKKDFSDKPDTSENQSEKSGVKRPGIFFDSSEDEIVKAKKRKFRRIFSCSSTQTTILEDIRPECYAPNDVTVPATQDDSKELHADNAGTVNINDTSSNVPSKNMKDMKKTTPSQQQKTKASIANYKAIQNIVTMCYKKCIKKVQSKSKNQNKPTFSESSLKHKVLSLGRKVIHKQGFECTGLLRYMEHKDLEISWQPTSRVNQNKSSNFVRIMTKLKSREDLENDDSSWKDLYGISFHSDQRVGSHVNDNNTGSIQTATIKTKEDEESSLRPDLTNEGQIDHIATNNCDDLNSKNKLLNKTPVANPKQLPKKSLSETKPTNIKASDTAVSQPINVSNQTEQTEFVDSNLCMPIITSTQSLSTVDDMGKKKDPIIDKPAPRIKVKPPSELMSQRALNNQAKSDEIWSFNERQTGLAYHFTNSAVVAPVPQSLPEHESHDALVEVSNTHAVESIEEQDKTNPREDKNLDYVTLDCLELPNKKTKFPFLYFKELLSYHMLWLLDINKELPVQFVRLIEFKLLLKQDTIRPLGVWLSLYCSGNTFCFAFKDTNLRKFDPNQLPAFWQWELLKIYKGDVVNKILHNASIKSKEMHGYTKTFLCLLRSIKCISEP